MMFGSRAERSISTRSGRLGRPHLTAGSPSEWPLVPQATIAAGMVPLPAIGPEHRSNVSFPHRRIHTSDPKWTVSLSVHKIRYLNISMGICV